MKNRHWGSSSFGHELSDAACVRKFQDEVAAPEIGRSLLTIDRLVRWPSFPLAYTDIEDDQLYGSSLEFQCRKSRLGRRYR